MSRRWISEEQLNNLPPGYKVRETGRNGANARRPSERAEDAPPPVVASTAPGPAKGGGMAAMQAKGRLQAGTMNATEAKYADHLGQLVLAGEVLWWKFEPVKLLLAPQTTLTPDFMVMLADGGLEMHDVKGSKAIYTDDAKVKMKVAAQAYPFVFRVVYPVKKADGGGWNIEVVNG